MIITKDKTVINSPPSSVTAHSGMLLQNPTALILSTISCGNVVEVNPPVPAAPMARDTMPCTMSKTASISSRPYCTAAFAADDPLAIVNNLSDFVFSLIRAVGVILLGWGVVQVGLSFQSHDPSQRSQGFLTLAGGLVITFAREILALIGVV